MASDFVLHVQLRTKPSGHGGLSAFVPRHSPFLSPMISLRFNLLSRIFRLRLSMVSLSRMHHGSHQGATLGALLLF